MDQVWIFDLFRPFSYCFLSAVDDWDFCVKTNTTRRSTHSILDISAVPVRILPTLYHAVLPSKIALVEGLAQRVVTTTFFSTSTYNTYDAAQADTTFQQQADTAVVVVVTGCSRCGSTYCWLDAVTLVVTHLGSPWLSSKISSSSIHPGLCPQKQDVLSC
jgi:hypothetical protein